jgi:hypothetical protein
MKMLSADIKVDIANIGLNSIIIRINKKYLGRFKQ